MRTIHIKAKSEADIMPAVRDAYRHARKGSKVAIVSTIQHLHKLEEAKSLLEEDKSKGIRAEIAGQVLGCRVPEIPGDTDQVLYIGSGRFHPIGILLRTGREVITANPLSGKAAKITRKDAETFEKRKRGALARFISSENIGVLVSTKKGQTGVQGGSKRIEEIKDRYNNKNFYDFAFNTLDKGELENFPFIDCWVNTACPRLFEDFEKGMINLEDIE
ncbi:MAG: diphthamide synthesis protein [Candidatus Woesearchaeota archaeon]